ncbi:MAG: uroporphyrinogen-III synthase [Chloroflexi bacterium]|nr:uroporphyrinogen-III synthase [Chloroflexota bacterium]
MADQGPLAGRTIAFLEARRSDELAHMVEKLGGSSFVAPALREVPTEDDSAARAWLDHLIGVGFDSVIFLTGVGCRALLDQADAEQRLATTLSALAETRVVARGPKPAHVLNEHHVRIDFIPAEPNTSQELLDGIRDWDLAGKEVGLQIYGGATPFLVLLRAGLSKREARVFEVAPYRWEGPADEQPLVDLVEALASGRIDALAIFSSSQIHNLFAIADVHGHTARLTEALNGPRVLVASIGPVATQAIEAHGVRVDLQPEHPKMGHLVTALGPALSARDSAMAGSVA